MRQVNVSRNNVGKYLNCQVLDDKLATEVLTAPRAISYRQWFAFVAQSLRPSIAKKNLLVFRVNGHSWVHKTVFSDRCR